ncbi:MAG: tRNA pseudouridine(55) synthase TruB [Phycisphaerales bacterium]
MTSPPHRQKPPRPNINGLLVVDKPKGPSSMDVVRVVRRRAGGAKTGHAGTLDPLATGVLLVLLGRATKQVERLMATEKRYEATVDLSAFSTTDDAEGERTPVVVESTPTRARIESELRERFTGAIEQRPPAFSAMKVGGRRAYKLARQGREVKLEARPVVIHEIRLLEYDWPLARLDIRCGKGTYIRSLARDLGAALGTGGYLADLRRTAVGPYTVDDAIALDEVPEPLTEAHLQSVE